MKKINKITNIALIFTLIGVFLGQNIAHALDISRLRVPVGHYGRIERTLSYAKNEILPKVVIIILHYGRENGNGEKDTLELLKNLGNLNYSNYEIILLDNNSPDGFFLKHKDSLTDEFPNLPKVTFIKNEVNLGFAEGNNLAMEYALNNKADYFFLLNNDTVIDKDLLTRLVEASETSEDIGVVGPKIYNYYKPNVIDNVRGMFFGRAFRYKEVDSGQYELDYVSGTAMLVKKSLFKEVGGMTKELFMYHEEVEWAMRIKKAGYKIVYVPEAKIWHKGVRASEEKFSPFVVYFGVRNRLYSIRHHPEYMIPLSIKLMLVTANSIRMAILKRDMKVFTSVVRGIYDGLLGRFSTVERGKVSIVTFNEDSSDKSIDIIIDDLIVRSSAAYTSL